MLKKSITYTDYNDEVCTDTLYFNLTKVEVMDLQDLAPRLSVWQSTMSGVERDLTTAEVKEILDIVKILIERSYGVRSADGKRFMKSPELYLEFTQSAVYDDFVFGLFENPQNAVDFMTGILPPGLSESAVEELKQIEQVELPSLDKKYEDYTEEELLSMPQSKFEMLVGDPNNMTREKLLLAMKRKSSIA